MLQGTGLCGLGKGVSIGGFGKLLCQLLTENKDSVGGELSGRSIDRFCLLSMVSYLYLNISAYIRTYSYMVWCIYIKCYS